MTDRSLPPDDIVTDLDGLVLLSGLVSTSSLPPSSDDWQIALGALRMIQMRAIMAGGSFSDLSLGSYVVEIACFGRLSALYTRSETDCVFLLFVLDHKAQPKPYKLISREILTRPVTDIKRLLRNRRETNDDRTTRRGF